ncbi:MAG: metallophosphoesterase [Candidatus Helarchaeota archaeon]
MKPGEFFAAFQNFDNRDSNEINELIEVVLPILKREAALIRIKSGLNSLFVGDLHGDYKTCEGVVRYFLEQQFNYIFFLGDYVDRGLGDMQIATLNLLLFLKRLYPYKVFLLRGNHEWNYINAEYGFKEAIYHHLNPILFHRYNELFNELPIAVKIEEPKILVVHGGPPISEQNCPYALKDIAQIPKNLCNSDQLGQQILWNDPSEKELKYRENYRGLGYIFGRNPFIEFMQYNDLEYCIRSHEVCKKGHKELFNGKLISIFSSRTCGRRVKPEILILNRDGKFEFKAA